jgi:8-oxo-dGTP pyrophosphatase MutT (NUDIX family)
LTNDIPVTCAVLYRVRDKFLICHSTGGPYWGLPKGIEDPEDPSKAYAAARELHEEVGIVISPDKLNFHGIYPYFENKHMAIFEYIAENEFPIKEMHCISMFRDKYGRVLPEVNAYKYVTLEESQDFINRATYRILRKVIK